MAFSSNSSLSSCNPRIVGFIASFIALPVAGFLMHQWLSNYAYHISLTWWMFLLPLVAVLLIALAVIGQQVLRAALANPDRFAQ